MMTIKPISHGPAYVITGPTSGIGRATALNLSKCGTTILVGRDPRKLGQLQEIIKQRGGHATSVICDLSDLESIRRAALDIIELSLPIAGLLNNAGVMLSSDAKTSQGWDVTFMTNYLGPFLLTEALIPHLPDGANIVSIVSAIEDPERKPAKVIGIKGGRFISIPASAKGQWKSGGCKIPGMDAYATSKLCSLAATLAMARETPRLRFNAVEPGINPSTQLGGGNSFLRLLFGQLITRLPPFRQYRSTPERAARIIAKVLIDSSVGTGIYYDEKGKPMHGSSLAHDPRFEDQVVTETRIFLAETQAKGNSNTLQAEKI